MASNQKQLQSYVKGDCNEPAHLRKVAKIVQITLFFSSFFFMKLAPTECWTCTGRIKETVISILQGVEKV